MPIRAQAAGGRVSPPSASGRPRAGPPWIGTFACGAPRERSRGGSPMTLLRRRPRVVYRVYAEDEFVGARDEFFDVAEGGLPSEGDRSQIGQLADGESEGAPVDVAGPVESFRPAASEVTEWRLRRLVGAAMLAGAVGAVGIAAANGLRAARSAGDRRTSGVSPPATRLHAATSWPSALHRRVVTRGALSASVERPAVGLAYISRGGPRRGGHGDGAWRSHAGATRPHAGLERGGLPAVVARSTPSAPSRPPRMAHGEFGFER
jgi:hypothetical protein